MQDTEEKRPLSLYIHIPFCKEKCKYCDFLSFGGCGYSLQKEYIEALLNEINVYKSISDSYIVQTIFLGGGTPSYINSEWIMEIMNRVRQFFLVAEDAEITIEGNPDSLTREHLADYRACGINRLSIGLQSANLESLKKLGRVHNFDQFVAAFNSARQAGFSNINVDLMSGLPGESMEEYVRSLARVVDMGPEHISAYSLIVEEGTPLSEDEALLDTLPSEEIDRQMYARTKTLLKSSGYTRYEISNYAKTGFSCRHNKVYWTGGEYLGLGLGASSYMKVMLSGGDCKVIRFHGVESIEEYIGRFMNCTGMREDDYTNLYHEIEELYSEMDTEEASTEDDYEDALYDDYSMYENMGAMLGMDLGESDVGMSYRESEQAKEHLQQYRELEDNAMLEFLRDYYRDLYFSKRKDQMEEMMFLGLRLMDGVSKEEFKKRFSVSIESIYGDIIEKYKNRGLLLEENGRIFLSDAGIDVSNVVMAEFML